MTSFAERALLPAGLRDMLPTEASLEAAAVERLMAAFAARGYARVKPPLIEFEDNLLAGSGGAMARQTFRLMDPVSRRMLGVRPDMTLQVARIAASRMGTTPRPLRLGYAGEVLRVQGSQLRPGRQFTQVGAELIGADTPAADVEVIVMAVEALTGLGIAGLSVDLGMPTLVPALCDALGIADEPRHRLRDALDHKDPARVSALEADLGRRGVTLFTALLGATGVVDRALADLAALDLPAAAADERAALAAVADGVRAAAPGLLLTADPVENRGFEYHSGVSFTFFARGIRGELGRGGRYRSDRTPDRDTRPGRDGEPATGLTLFMDSVLRALPEATPPPRLFLPPGTDAGVGHAMRGRGFVTVAGLAPVGNPAAEARRLGCSHVLEDGGPRRLDGHDDRPA